MTERRRRLLRPYPMMRVLDRLPEPGFAGPVCVWDIDQTYLDTRLAHWVSMLAIPLEFGIDKRPVAGSVRLLHALRDGKGREHRPLYFVSASPPEISGAIERRMLMDGVEWDGIFYKDAFAMVRRVRAHEIPHHVPYKLSALLLLLAELPAGATLQLFGDDLEKDALSYALAADVAAGRLRGKALEKVLRAARAPARDVREIVPLADALPVREAVAGIHIRLVRAPDGSRLAGYPPQVLGHPTYGSAARWLQAKDLISGEAADEVEALSGASIPVPGGAPEDLKGFRTPAELRARAGI